MKVDLGNVTARVAFKCARKNYSEIILDASGAELLQKAGDLLFKSPVHDGMKRAQGIFFKKAEILGAVSRCERQHKQPSFMFRIPADVLDPQKSQVVFDSSLLLQPLPRKPLTMENQFAEIILWALSRDSVSTNLLMTEHSLGWNKASHIIRRLEELGIVEPLDGKQARHVIPTTFDDLTDNLLNFLHQNGIDDARLIKGIASR